MQIDIGTQMEEPLEKALSDLVSIHNQSLYKAMMFHRFDDNGHDIKAAHHFSSYAAHLIFLQLLFVF